MRVRAKPAPSFPNRNQTDIFSPHGPALFPRRSAGLVPRLVKSSFLMKDHGKSGGIRVWSPPFPASYTVNHLSPLKLNMKPNPRRSAAFFKLLIHWETSRIHKPLLLCSRQRLSGPQISSPWPARLRPRNVNPDFFAAGTPRPEFDLER
jgi:hypothetical protein